MSSIYNESLRKRHPHHPEETSQFTETEEDPSPVTLAGRPIYLYLIQAPVNGAFACLNASIPYLTHKVMQSVHFIFSIMTGFWQFFINNSYAYFSESASLSPEEANEKIAEMFKELLVLEANPKRVSDAWIQLQKIESPMDRLGVASIFYELACVNPSLRMDLDDLQNIWADMQSVEDPVERLEFQEFFMNILKTQEQKRMARPHLPKGEEKINRANENWQKHPHKRASNSRKKSVCFSKERIVINFKVEPKDGLRNGPVTSVVREKFIGKERENQRFNEYFDTYDEKPEKHQRKFIK